MRLPVRPIRGRWPKPLESHAARFFWPDPAVLLDDETDPETFRALMSQVHVGGTIKITGANRHPEADDLLIDHVELAGASIVDIGASDGSTSLDLIDRLPTFRSYTIADLHMTLSAVPTRHGWAFFDGAGTCVLICGRRTIAWPTQSKLVRMAFSRSIRIAAARKIVATEVMLINPEVRHRLAQDARLTTAVHDVFTVWPDPKPDVIKVANLLRRLYFDEPKLAEGLRALTRSLPEGGHLLIVDNPRTADPSPRGGLYRRERGRLVMVAETERPPELADLIAAAQDTLND